MTDHHETHIFLEVAKMDTRTTCVMVIVMVLGIKMIEDTIEIITTIITIIITTTITTIITITIIISMLMDVIDGHHQIQIKLPYIDNAENIETDKMMEGVEVVEVVGIDNHGP